MEARKSTIRNGRPGKLERGASWTLTITGRRGRTERPAPERREAQAERTQVQARGRIRKGASRRGSRAWWSTGRWELATARGKGRKAGAICGGTSQRPIAGGLGKGAQVLETNARVRRSSWRKPVGTADQEACQRAASERRRKGESRCAGERQARRLAGRNGRRRGARAQRQVPEPEGGSRVVRKRGAQALSGSSI